VSRGLVVIAHGVSEHSDRYAHVGKRLSASGYGVYALDHRDHEILNEPEQEQVLSDLLE
jgi:alpha-beta hydrolase superfamily lysophospholipase